MKQTLRAPGRPLELPGIPATTLTLSLVLHLAAFGAAIGLPRLLPRERVTSQVYVVDLVSLPAAGPAIPPGPGRAARAAKAEPPTTKPEKAITLPEPRVTKPEPKPPPAKKKPPEAKQPESKPMAPEKPRQPPKAPAPEAAPAVVASAGASAPGGPVAGAAGTAAGEGATGAGAGGTGTGSGQADADTYYAGLLKRRIESAWNRPIYPPDWTESADPTATVRIVLTASGRVTEVVLVTPSGYEGMDRSIMRAVQDAQPFPPFPALMGRASLTVRIDFVLPPK